jgi:hypothetical protein
MLERNAHILLSAMLASVFACVLPAGELEEFTEERASVESEFQDLDEEVILKELSSESLSAEAIRLRTNKDIRFGGTFLEEDHEVTVEVDRLCSPGWTRVSPPEVTHSGHGSCWFKGWLDPYNPNDCRARINLHHSAGFLYGECYIKIFETDANLNSCSGACGGRAAGGCYCDSYCRTADDCCADYDPVCAPPELYQTGLSGSAGSWRHYTISVPSGRSKLVARITGGSGDGDLYVRYGAPPTESAYNCRPYIGGNEETCSITSPSAGTWYVSVRGYSSYSGVTLTADHDK